MIATLLVGTLAANAVSVLQLDLKGLCSRADRIVRATVMDISPGAVAAGGGKIPTVRYRLRVKETVAGQAIGVVDLTMVGNLKAEPVRGGMQRFSPFSDLPRLEPGHEYLLFTTRASRAGLSTTVGLGQGCFKIFMRNKTEYAINGGNNGGLGLGDAGAIEYERLVQQIREIRGN